ncbi:MAG: CoA-binding protein [Candidatus Diapherotrites archaeon]|nr:CoA-binding protein [Candidatus Diapherotrites archaeon]
MENPNEKELKELLQNVKVIAVVGCSRHSYKAAHSVPAYLQKKGYKIVPINPFAEEVLGEKSYPNLLELPGKVANTIDLINVFRPRNQAEMLVKQSIDFKKKFQANLNAVWLQEGIYLNEKEQDTKMNAEANGIQLVQDLCIYKEHARLML